MAKPKILQQLNAEKESKILLASDPTQNMEAASKQYVDNSGGTFYAIYGTTTYNEIVNAYNSGKSIFCYNQSMECIVPLINPSTEYGFTFGYFFSFGITPKTSFTCKPNGTWSTSSSSDMQGFNTLDPCTSTTTNIPISSSTKYFRPILISTNEPTSNDGNVGDIWFVYEA